jgi:ABC-2 type transport system ATP-binding protein
VEDVIYTRGLTRRFGDFTAVEALDLSVRRGSIFGFLGPNGSGKTTTIRMLCSLLKPSEGEGFVLGFDITSEAGDIRSRIGYMSQRFSLYPELTAGENLKFYAGMYSIPMRRRKSRIDEAAKLTGISGTRESLVAELGTGIRQRLALACALLHEPDLIFLDEPTSGVDPASRRSFWNLIYELADRGTTVLVTTHFMDEAEHCDDLAFLYNGTLIARGSPGELKETLPGELFKIPSEDPVGLLETLEKSGKAFDDAYVSGRDVHFLSQGGPPEGLEATRARPALEDVFVHLVSSRRNKVGS